MSGLNLNKKLWRIPQQGMVRGVCAGLAHYLDVPVKLVRVVTVLSIFFGLAFITTVAYIVLSLCLTRCRRRTGGGRRSHQQRSPQCSGCATRRR